MNDAPITWNPTPSKPKLKLPAGATDTHVHVFGPTARFPYPQASKYKPGDAPKEELFKLHDMLGIERCVIVQSGVHGYDNSVVADAMAGRPGRYLGIALAPHDIADEEISLLNGMGFRGVRFNYMSHLAPGAGPDELRALAPRLADAGWQLLVHMEAGLIEQMAPVLAELPCPVVIDHMGRIDATQGMDQAPFNALMRLGENEHIWIKVSGSERCSGLDAPYADATPFAAKLVRAFPDRTIWGTDWPHPNFRATPPDDGVLVDLLADICSDEASLKRVLVDNPARLYGFGDAT